MSPAKPPHWNNWSERLIQPEILERVSDSQMRRNLQEIARVNRWFGGHGVARSLFREFVSRTDTFTVLDVGAASGEMGRAIRKGFPKAQVISLDRAFRHVANAPRPCLAGDAFRLPLRERGVDFVFCSLFLHHFENSEVAALLRSFARVARQAVLAVDLERRRPAYHFLPATRWLFRWDDVMLHDGPISVRAAFRRKELLAVANSAGLGKARVRRHDPWFRLSLAAPVE